MNKFQNVLITAPSLNENDNVSGISTIVRTIIGNSGGRVNFFHFRIGNKDGEPKGFKWIGDQFRLLPRLAAFIREKKIDAIHLNTDFTKPSLIRNMAVSSFLKRVLKKPILVHIHGGYMLMNPPAKGSIYSAIISRLLKNADVIVVLSGIEQAQLKANFNAEAHVLANAVEPVPSPGHRDFYGKIRFIFLGRMVREKGIYLIAEAMKELDTYHNLFNFTLYGAGPELPGLLNQLETIKTLDFEYNGVAKGDEKWAALKKADVFLLPSLYGEGMPIAMLEAMQAGCIPVVSDDASITTVVDNAVNGFVVKKGSKEELVSTLKNILTERGNLEWISNTARATIAEKYGISKYMENLVSYYSIFPNALK